VTVVVLATGIDDTHPDLQGKVDISKSLSAAPTRPGRR
jgi:hypothetical protein